MNEMKPMINVRYGTIKPQSRWPDARKREKMERQQIVKTTEEQWKEDLSHESKEQAKKSRGKIDHKIEDLERQAWAVW